MADGDLAARAIAEARGLHAFFVAWFRGESGPAAGFARCESALAPDFRMITPDGAIHARDAVIARLRTLHGSAPQDFAIDILDPHMVWRAGDAVLLEFTERQYRDGRSGDRRSTALFTSEPTAPEGVIWRHLQETWIATGNDAPDTIRDGS